MPRRKPPIVRVEKTKIVIEYYSGTETGTTIAQLQRLLAAQGYIRINKNELVYLAGAITFNGDILSFGEGERFQIKVPRRMKKEISDYFSTLKEE